MKRFYENLAGVKKNAICVPNLPMSAIKKSERRYVARMRKKYGFAPAETYSLDYTAAIWLYEHLKGMLEIGGKIVNYDYDWGADHWTEEEKAIFQKEGIDPKTDREVFEYICKLIEDGFKCFEEDDFETRLIDCFKRAFRIWAEVMPRAWW